MTPDPAPSPCTECAWYVDGLDRCLAHREVHPETCPERRTEDEIDDPPENLT